MYASALCVCLVPAEARRECYTLLKLQLEMVVSFMWVLGVKLASSGRAAAAFDVSRGLLGGTELQSAFLTSCWAELITNVVKSNRGNHRLSVQISEFIE